MLKENIKAGDVVYFYEKSYDTILRGVVSALKEKTVEIDCIYRRISRNDGFCPQFGAYEGTYEEIYLSEEEAWNSRTKKKLLEIPVEMYDKLGRVWELHRAKTDDEWEVCLDGIWYRLNLDMDTSDRAYLLLTIVNNGLELQGIPFWNCCKDIKNSDFNKMVQTDEDTVYLLEYKK